MLHFQASSWTVACLATVCGFVMPILVGFEINVASLISWTGMIILLMGLQLFYVNFRKNPILANLLGTMAVTAWSLSMVGIIALAGLGMNAPLVDQRLIEIDVAMGLDAKVVVEWLSQWDAVVIFMNIFYMSSVPLIFVTLVMLIIKFEHEQAWRFCTCITGSALVCALLSAVWPAVGAFATLDVSGDALARLPVGAGVYHLPLFEGYREGKMRIIDVTKLEGVVTFPSFHTAMAIATAHAWRRTPFCATPIALWNGGVILSAILIGGHYFIDLIAGAALCLVLILLTRTRRVEARALPISPLDVASSRKALQHA